MQARLRSLSNDSGSTFITNEDLKDWINEGYTDLVTREQLLVAESAKAMGDSGTSVANGTFDLPTDFLAVVGFRVGTADVDFVDDSYFWDYTDAGTTPITTFARIWNSKIELYPKPSSGTSVTLRYVKQPADLSAGGDTPAIPTNLHPKLVYYAAARMKMKEGDGQAAEMYLMSYERNLRDPDHRQGLIPGPLVIQMAPGPFDTSETTHA